VGQDRKQLAVEAAETAATVAEAEEADPEAAYSSAMLVGMPALWGRRKIENPPFGASWRWVRERREKTWAKMAEEGAETRVMVIGVSED